MDGRAPEGLNGFFLSLGREVVQNDGPLLALLAPIPHHDAGAVDDLPGIAFAVEHA